VVVAVLGTPDERRKKRHPMGEALPIPR
jgi:hypothetical protein